MSHLVPLSVLLTSFAVSGVRPIATQQKRDDKKGTKLLISRMQVFRTAVLYEEPQVVPTCFELELFANTGAGREIRRYRARLLELDDIHDETGKLLLTEARRAAIPALSSEVLLTDMHLISDILGPVLTLRMDAPDPKARKLKRVRGKLQIALGDVQRLEFKDVVSLAGKKLDHPDLGNLIVNVDLVNETGMLTVKLKYSGRRDRILEWAVARNGQFLPPFAISSDGPNKLATEQSKTYETGSSENLELWLAIPKAGVAQTIEFDWRDVSLP